MRTVGKYELIEPIGEGGMGMVWKARHVDLHRLVALKQMHADRAGDLMLQRFLREAQSAASVRAPNVVDVLDYGQDASGDPYLVMELLEGETLAARLKVEYLAFRDNQFVKIGKMIAFQQKTLERKTRHLARQIAHWKSSIYPAPSGLTDPCFVINLRNYKCHLRGE